MDTGFFSVPSFSFWVNHATYPIAPLVPRLVLLLRLAGMSPLRCYAYPAASPAAHLGMSNCFL